MSADLETRPSLADDVEALRLFSLGESVPDLYGSLARILAICEPLASLTPEQARMLATCAVHEHQRGTDESYVEAHRIASTIFSRLGET